MPLVTFDDKPIFDFNTTSNSLTIGDILIQWGQANASNSASTQVNFPKNYASVPQVFLTMSNVSRATDVRTPQPESITTTGFTFFISARNSSQNYYSGAGAFWLAIGVK